MTHPKWINPKLRESKPVIQNIIGTIKYFGKGQMFGAIPIVGFIVLLTSGIWFNNLRFQEHNYYSLKDYQDTSSSSTH